jgi:hypothetical protein
MGPAERSPGPQPIPAMTPKFQYSSRTLDTRADWSAGANRNHRPKSPLKCRAKRPSSALRSTSVSSTSKTMEAGIETIQSIRISQADFCVWYTTHCGLSFALDEWPVRFSSSPAILLRLMFISASCRQDGPRERKPRDAGPGPWDPSPNEVAVVSACLTRTYRARCSSVHRVSDANRPFWLRRRLTPDERGLVRPWRLRS